MEIRTLRASEREAFLDLLDGWELPDGWRGRSADFFRRYVEHDPSYADENVFVAADGGRLVSCVQIFPRRLRVGEAAVATGGIGSVFTRPEARAGGVASALLERAADAMRSRGMALSLLFASRLDFYARLGWESWPGSRTLVRRDGEAAPAAAGDPPLAPGAGVEAGLEIGPFAAGQDLRAVRALHDAYTAKRPGTVCRDEAAWQATLRNGGNPLEEFLVARRGGEAVAYARAAVLSGFLLVTELGRGEAKADADALAALVLRLLTPRQDDPLEVPGRPSRELRALGVAPPLFDEPLADALAARGLRLDGHPDPHAMLRCLDADGLARAAGAARAPGEAGPALLRRLLPPERFSFWPADRF